MGLNDYELGKKHGAKKECRRIAEELRNVRSKLRRTKEISNIEFEAFKMGFLSCKAMMLNVVCNVKEDRT